MGGGQEVCSRDHLSQLSGPEIANLWRGLTDDSARMVRRWWIAGYRITQDSYD